MVVLEARPPTKEKFAILAIENGKVRSAKLSRLARAYPGFLRIKPFGLFLLPPLNGILVQSGVTLSTLHSPVPFIHWGRKTPPPPPTPL